MASDNLSLFNDGSHTYFNVAHNSTSPIDLSIYFSDIFLDYVWSVLGALYGSDHWPIYLKLAVNAPSKSRPKWKVNEADWPSFTQHVVLE